MSIHKIKYADLLHLLLLLLISSQAFAQSSDKTEKELIKIQNDWAEARVKGDVAFLENLYAKELRLNVANGNITERSVDIDLFRTKSIQPEYIKDVEMKVSVYEKTAVVTGIENLKGTYKGISSEMSLRFTNVFVHRDGRWQLVAHQSTPIQKRALQSTLEDSKTLVDKFITAWNTHDMKKFDQLFTDTAYWVPTVDSRLDGRVNIVADIQKAHEIWAGKTTVAASEIVMRRVATDVVVILFHMSFLDANGKPAGSPNVLQIVAVRDNDEWKIAAGQLTKPGASVMPRN